MDPTSAGIESQCKEMKSKNSTKPKPFVTDVERQRRLLIERYMQLKQNSSYNSGNEIYPWLNDANKNRYSCGVNVNNWQEERHDTKNRRQPLSDFDHAYKTEYRTRLGENVKGINIATSRNGKSFPGHQPPLDPPSPKKVYNSYETTSRAAFQDPRSIATRVPETQCKYCRLRMERGHNT